MKRLIEEMKERKPRIPLPELTDADKEKLGDRGQGYEARLRYHYMPGSDGGRGAGGSGFSFGPTGTEATLENTFKVQLFWIVSRANNCQYCQGHQEGKLLRAGQTEDEIAALDGDWAQFTEGQRVAFAFGRKFTYEPHLLTDADVADAVELAVARDVVQLIQYVTTRASFDRITEAAGLQLEK